MVCALLAACLDFWCSLLLNGSSISHIMLYPYTGMALVQFIDTSTWFFSFNYV